MKMLNRLWSRARDEVGCGLVALGVLAMTDECVVEVVEAMAETVAEQMGGAVDSPAPAIRLVPRDAGR